MILYHFPVSPFSRRVRLALAYKGLSAELRDARANPEYMRELQSLHPMHTAPTLVDGERVVVDSSAICRYLDDKAPTPPFWPTDPSSFELIALNDGVLQTLIDLGMRYYPLHDHPSFPQVRDTLVGRAQRALEAIAAKIGTSDTPDGPLAPNHWGAVEIFVFSTVFWLEGLAARAATVPAARQILELGWSVPSSLSAWAAQHRERSDVRALG